MSTYVYRDGRSLPVDPQVLGDAVERAGSAEGLVELAQPKRSPLHGLFEWDDVVAAHRHRVAQAGQIIRSLDVIVDGGGSAGPVHVAAFVHANPQGESNVAGYVSVSAAAGDALMAEQVRRETLRQIAGLRRRLVSLSQFPSLVAELAAVLEDEDAA